MENEPPKNVLAQLMAELPKGPPPLPSIQHLLFEAPLYKAYSLGEDLEHYRRIYGRALDNYNQHYTPTLDGYCRDCQSSATFAIIGAHIPSGDAWTGIRLRHAFDAMEIKCTRHQHVVRYFLYVKKGTIVKVGQFPSLADIANNETREKYKRVLRGNNWSELYKAIGLAAHGEGIGAFVYLRRVFERLIVSRFNDFKTSDGWKDQDFVSLHMDQKIEFLKGHLPTFLVENRKLYSIYSIGVHELENDKCLEFFPIGKGAILMILEEDLAKRDQLDRQKELKEQIAKFQKPNP
jgi:hypothetical protein